MLEKAKAIEYLKEYLEEGDTVYCVLDHVSRSGMLRVISFVIPTPADKHNDHLGIINISHLVGPAAGYKHDKNRRGLRVSGMDAGFSVVYNLASELFGDGYALKSSWLN